jgi:hypothetical protein
MLVVVYLRSYDEDLITIRLMSLRRCKFWPTSTLSLKFIPQIFRPHVRCPGIDLAKL